MYQLDTTLASKADTIGAYINETGKYVGTFTRAEALVSKNKGTHGVGFTFKADDGRETKFDIWVKKPNGEALTGLNQLNAIMACLKARQINVQKMDVKKWDNGAEKIMTADCFPDLMNKKIGLLLRSEEYPKMQDNVETGEYGWRMGLFAIFQADTELMASEILARKTQPEQLAKVIVMLADKPLKNKRSGGNRAAPSGAPDPINFQDDEDIPF